MTLQRTAWLGRPWFLLAVAVLAVNDHILKGMWPGWLTGKLSDFAGLVVVATLGSVVLGPSWGIVVAGLGFVALKTLPGMAEAVAPLMGGGVTLRDPTDLLAIVVLPLLWFMLRRQRPDRANRRRAGWTVVGLVAALVTTSATSQPPEDRATGSVWYAGDSFYAAVDVGRSTVFVRSTDARSWVRLDHLPTGVEDPGFRRDYVPCAADLICYRVGWYQATRARDPRSNDITIERRTAYGWEVDWESAPDAVVCCGAINPADIDEVAFLADFRSIMHRTGPQTWETVDVVQAAGGEAPRSQWAYLWLLVPPLLALGAGVGAIMLARAAVRVAVRLVRGRGFDPPSGAR